MLTSLCRISRHSRWPVDIRARVDGAEASLVFDTESDPDRPSLSAPVPAGSYGSFLDPGWRLERLQPEGAQTVEVATVAESGQFSVVQDLSTVPTI